MAPTPDARRIIARKRDGHELSAEAIRASILEYGWSEVASATIDEYSTALGLHPIESYTVRRGVASIR